MKQSIRCSLVLRSVVLALCILGIVSPGLGENPGVAATGGWHGLERATSVTAFPPNSTGGGVELHAGRAVMRVTALTDSVVRVQIALDGAFPVENSWAVTPEARAAKLNLEARFEDSPQAVVLHTKNIQVRIEKEHLRVIFMDSSGKIISEDDPQRPLMWNRMKLASAPIAASFTEPARADATVTQFKMWKVMPENEHYFGLGDKAGPLDHRNQAFTMWNTDAYGWLSTTDPLYKTIPFFVAMREGRGYGIFFDNTFRSTFDFGKSERDAFSYGADDGPIDYYFFYGPHPKKVIEEYTALTGRTPMPPLWTLGYQQSRYSYYPESRVREIADTFRAKKIPLDALYLDIDYQKGNAPFTINREIFPHFEGLVGDLKKQGIKTVVISDLHIKKEAGYPPYDSGIKQDRFVKNPGGSVYEGVVWPGASVFPDFTAGAATREWYGALYKDFVAAGIKGFWNDMNEPAVFERADKTMPLDTVHRVAMPDGSVRPASHREIHNVFGMENVHATYDGLLKLDPDVRPFVLTRAAYAGTQRYAASWTGDNSSSWEHLRGSVANIMNLGISGYALVGADIGGYRGSPLPDVYTRWLELGAFNPIYRSHTEKGSDNQEPWVHGPVHEAIRRKYIELRYRLLPYTYTAMEENTRTGVPLVRALFLEYPQEGAVLTLDREFLYGRDLLVAPQLWEYFNFVEVQLPQGDWYDYWTGELVHGGRAITRKTGLEMLPLYVRAGAIIPQQPLVQSTDEIPQGPLQIRVYPPAGGGDCSGSVYADDGLSLQYKKGAYKRVKFTCSASAAGLSIRMAQEGDYSPWWKGVRIDVIGGKGVGRATLAGKALPTSFAGGMLSVEAPSADGEVLVSY